MICENCGAPITLVNHRGRCENCRSIVAVAQAERVASGVERLTDITARREIADLTERRDRWDAELATARRDMAKASVPAMDKMSRSDFAGLVFVFLLCWLLSATILVPLFGLGGGIGNVLAFILGLLLCGAWAILTGPNKAKAKRAAASAPYLAYITVLERQIAEGNARLAELSGLSGSV